MGILKEKESAIEQKSLVIKGVLAYFSSKEQEFTKDQIEKISAASDHAFTDDILYEEFVNWTNGKDDEVFLFLIQDYWESYKKPALDPAERDLTGQDQKVLEIKESERKQQQKDFSQVLNDLSNQKGLKTHNEIGKYLGVSGERARVLLSGQNKPQRKTILKIAEKFQIDPEEIYKKIL